jgi:hypothetical protein
MRSAALILLVSIALFSCSHTSGKYKGELPSDSIIPYDRMVKITADVHIAEAILHQVRVRDKVTDSIRDAYMNFVWKKHHISRQRFLGNIEYLKQDPDGFIKFYSDVTTYLDEQGKVLGKVKGKGKGKE